MQQQMVEPTVMLEIERAMRIYGSVTVRCDSCGHGWKHKQGNDLHCRFCGGGVRNPVLIGSLVEV